MKHNNAFSLILISKDHRTIRRWEVKRQWLKWVGGVTGALALGFAGASTGFYHYWKAFNATESIRIQNAEYDQEREALHARVAALEGTIERADRLVARLEGDEKIPKTGAVTESIGPISEAADLPNVASLNASGGLRLSSDDGRSNTLAFADINSKLSNLSDNARNVEQRLGKIYEVRKSRNTYWSALPSSWPVRGYITSGFGPRGATSVGGTRYHEGIDIAAPVGTEVLASGDGVVTFAGYKGGFGRAVIIDHGFGISTLYAHNSQVLVAEGQRVARGTPVSAIGMTGRTTGPHLHYEVLVDGVPVDPLRYLAGRK